MTVAPVTIETLPAQTVAYAICSGSYANLPKRLNRLFDWLKEHGLPMAGPPCGRLPGPTEEAAAGKFMWELLVPVPEATLLQAPDAEQFGIKRIDAREVAVVLYHGPYDTTSKAFPAPKDWITSHGYDFAGISEEWWLDDDDDVAPNELRTKIAYPVKMK